MAKKKKVENWNKNRYLAETERVRVWFDGAALIIRELSIGIAKVISSVGALGFVLYLIFEHFQRFL
ncbi:hypothetical protein N473_01320 [Pseudoalteromonas luteoviolacea CPMOR-1]|uniref:Uncharacterized protein n=1 Tax=Pseudoalteromonas luteoviolacea CPMOR-1 TaxID=1365248 RepID=A0A167LUK5_9GAMM|nr:hypothetical protein [Pseudoalteromonas luteoviolacea]KZN65242.1 hypothetical protein N473_01320 [Pseudoalteromonas luteoviolacea CPMOR-1]